VGNRDSSECLQEAQRIDHTHAWRAERETLADRREEYVLTVWRESDI
jgi:hypothetical protein